MVERLIEVCAREKYIVLMITAAMVVLGIWTLYNQPIDAIPDLSDTQVIIYSKWDRSPDLIEDQVTYPIITACWERPRSRPFVASLILGSPTSTSSSRTAQTSIGPAAAFSNI